MCRTCGTTGITTDSIAECSGPDRYRPVLISFFIPILIAVTGYSGGGFTHGTSLTGWTQTGRRAIMERSDMRIAAAKILREEAETVTVLIEQNDNFVQFRVEHVPEWHFFGLQPLLKAVSRL